MDEQAIDSGAAYLFHRSAGSWHFVSYLKAPNTSASDAFGSSIALSKTWIAVGAPFESSASASNMFDDSLLMSGAAYVYSLTHTP